MKFAHAFIVVAGCFLLAACARETTVTDDAPTTNANEVLVQTGAEKTARLLVRFKDESDFDSKALHQVMGTKLIRQYSSIKGLELVEITSGQDLQQVIAKYQANAHVLYAEPDSTVSAQ